LCFSLPWYEYDIEGDNEKFYYGDFGDNFEERFSSDYDSYYHDSANLSIIGYSFLIIISILFILEGRNNLISKFILNSIIRKPMPPDLTISTSILVIVLALLAIIPITLVIIGGMRFIGFSIMNQSTMDSFRFEGERNYTSISHGTQAGFAAAIIGIIIFCIIIILAYQIFTKLFSFTGFTGSKFIFISRLKKLGTLFLVLSVIGLISIPVLSLVNRDFESYYQFDSEIEHRSEGSYFFNDGSIHINAESSWGGGNELDDEFEDIDSNIWLIAWTLVIALLFSILLLFGLILFIFNKHPKVAHQN
jgi:hypothetical protein